MGAYLTKSLPSRARHAPVLSVENICVGVEVVDNSLADLLRRRNVRDNALARSGWREVRMRWDNLFDDLETQLENELTAEEIDLRAEEERLRLARLGMRERLIALTTSDEVGRMLRLILRDGTRIAAIPGTFGRDWFAGELCEEGSRRPGCIVPIDAIAGVVLSRPQVTASLVPLQQTPAARALAERLGMPFVLRDLCRRRQPVELRLMGEVIFGTLDRIGRDHCDIAIHEPGGVRRESAVTEYRVVRLDQVLLVRL